MTTLWTPQTPILSVDTEYTGRDWDLIQLIELGMYVVEPLANEGNGRCVWAQNIILPHPRMYRPDDPNVDHWTSEAEDVHRISRHDRDKWGLDTNEIIRSIKWSLRSSPGLRALEFWGSWTCNDLTILKKALWPANMLPRYHVDFKNVVWDAMNTMWYLTNKTAYDVGLDDMLVLYHWENESLEYLSLEDLNQILGLPDYDAHCALEDAKACYEVTRDFMQWYTKTMNTKYYPTLGTDILKLCVQLNTRDTVRGVPREHGTSIMRGPVPYLIERLLLDTQIPGMYSVWETQ